MANITTPLDDFFANVLGYSPGNGANGSNLVTVAQLHQALSTMIQEAPMNDPPLATVE